MKSKTQEPLNPSFKEEVERILGEIRKNIINLEHSDLQELKKFTNKREYHYPTL